MISKSYPYLSIAKKYGVPYEDVLNAADYFTHGVNRNTRPILLDGEVIGEILDAGKHFYDVQRGVAPFQ